MVFLRLTIVAIMLNIIMSYAMDEQEEYAICRSIEIERENKKYFEALSTEARKSLIEGYAKSKNAKQLKARQEFAGLKTQTEQHKYLQRYTKWIEHGS